jgi:hypothetical protein
LLPPSLLKNSLNSFTGCYITQHNIELQHQKLFFLQRFHKWAKMLTLEQIKELLKDRRIGMLADATGVHVNTIRDIRDNPDSNPTYKVLVALSDYFENKND